MQNDYCIMIIASWLLWMTIPYWLLHNDYCVWCVSRTMNRSSPLLQNTNKTKCLCILKRRTGYSKGTKTTASLLPTNPSYVCRLVLDLHSSAQTHHLLQLFFFLFPFSNKINRIPTPIVNCTLFIIHISIFLILNTLLTVQAFINDNNW